LEAISINPPPKEASIINNSCVASLGYFVKKIPKV